MGDGEAKTIINKYKFGWTFESSDFKQLNEHLRDRKINNDNIKEFRKSFTWHERSKEFQQRCEKFQNYLTDVHYLSPISSNW